MKPKGYKIKLLKSAKMPKTFLPVRRQMRVYSAAASLVFIVCGGAVVTSDTVVNRRFGIRLSIVVIVFGVLFLVGPCRLRSSKYTGCYFQDKR